MADGLPPAIVNVEYVEGHNPLDGGAKDRILESIRRMGAHGYTLAHQAVWDFTFLRIDF